MISHMMQAHGALKHLLADAHDMAQHTPLHQLLWMELVFFSLVFSFRQRFQ